MRCDDVRAGRALAHGSFRQTGDANLPLVSSGGAPLRKPGLEAAGRPGVQPGPLVTRGASPCTRPCPAPATYDASRARPSGNRTEPGYSLACVSCQEQNRNKIDGTTPLVLVIAGLVPAIHAFTLRKDVDTRHKAGHDKQSVISPVPRTGPGALQRRVGTQSRRREPTPPALPLPNDRASHAAAAPGAARSARSSRVVTTRANSYRRVATWAAWLARAGIVPPAPSGRSKQSQASSTRTMS